MRNIIFYILVSVCIAGCISAKAKLSGTDIVSPYGTANSLNTEVEINAHQ